MSGMPSSMVESSNTRSSSLVVVIHIDSQLTDCTDWSDAMAKFLRSVSKDFE